MATAPRTVSDVNSDNFNIAVRIDQMGDRFGTKNALFEPLTRDQSGLFKYRVLSFAQLAQLSNHYAAAFAGAGIGAGTRVLLLMKPGLELSAVVFALFKTGAVPVLVDPGLGLKNMLGCIRRTAPEAMIALNAAHWIRKIFPSTFRTVRIKFGIGGLTPPGVINLGSIISIDQLGETNIPLFEAVKVMPEDMAAIVFTSGSTGPPKGVVYTHRIFHTQLENISKVYGAGPEQIDMSAFPLFALLAVASGMPSVIPKMDFRRPAEVNPENIIREVNAHRVTFSFGSPALWRTTANYALSHNLKMPTLKNVLMAGAPVGEDLHRKVKAVIASDGETWVPYGATEALTTCTFKGSEMLSETAAKTREGQGYCVGYPNPGMEVKIIVCSDERIAEFSPELELPCGERGEIIVRGNVVKAAYYNDSEATANSEIADSAGGKWHRMGDVGYFDGQGRLWFCGRKNHMFHTAGMVYYPVCSEAIFNQHPEIYRTALVRGLNGPVLFVEPLPGNFPRRTAQREKIVDELLELGSKYTFTAEIYDIRFIKALPVDIRHNAKIFREKLSIRACQ
ncbi:MAG: AMP-binding protein [Lentisphaerae bacterium]|nr:fatty acid CoA ligase family protein [Victivallaceae bacterium]MDD3703456.1 fatty acid CoA ligase family protein [Victivallaceae bacterium]NLK82626.1 AMP-binding protein [Lentisphaerota bacterium]